MDNKNYTLPVWLIAVSLIGLNIFAALNYFKTNTQLTTVTQPINQSSSDGVPPINSIPDLPVTSIFFKTTTHDFGVIKDDKKVYTTFTFTNTGNEPLMILSAEGSCGCTVPTWPKEPVAPGKSAEIEIAFDPNGKTGEHSKIVTITANTEPTTTILTVKANIVKS